MKHWSVRNNYYNQRDTSTACCRCREGYLSRHCNYFAKLETNRQSTSRLSITNTIIMVLQSRSERELNIFVVKTVRTHTTHKALVSAAPSLKYSRVMNRLNVELMSTSSCTQSSAILPLTSAVTSRAGGGVDGRWWSWGGLVSALLGGPSSAVVRRSLSLNVPPSTPSTRRHVT